MKATVDLNKETENWQKMMFSCRQACKILGMEYNEPEFLNWTAGRDYYNKLWQRIRSRNEQEKY